MFISHAFGGADEELAGALKKDLAAAGLEGYMAEKEQRYDLLISDKIRHEIDESDWLVAIITERGLASASLHEEIGYALKGGARVALMIEEGVEKRGMLVYGKEYETFTVPNFAEHLRKVALSMSKTARSVSLQFPIREETKLFLEKRKILSANPSNFAVNEHFPHLDSPLLDAKKPVVLFTACPYDLRNNANVTAPEFLEWVKATATVNVDGRSLRVRGLEPHVNCRRLLAIDEHPHARSRKVIAYREFDAGGFFEFGTSHLFLGRNDRGKMELSLCHMAGELWSFLAQARLFYQKTEIDIPFYVFVSIRNSDHLRLGNYGNEAMTYSQYGGLALAPHAPVTHHKTITSCPLFKLDSRATDADIARAAREAAREVCNAYGETTPKCYGADGSFSWGLWDKIHTKAAGGGRL